MNAPLLFEEDETSMYSDWGDHDLPEDNARARELVAKIGRGDNWLADAVAAGAIAIAILLALYAVDVKPGTMLAMFAGSQVQAEAPTIKAPTTEWKRKP